MADKSLDCRQLKCPLPIVKIGKAIKELSPGQTLSVEADDPAFKSDVYAWAQIMGHQLLEFSDGPIQRAVIKKS